MNSKKIAFVSLGCAKNLCDTEVMLKKMADAGYDIVPEANEPKMFYKVKVISK